MRKFFLRNHLKYTLLYLNLPSGNKQFHPQVLWKRNLRVFLFSADYTRVKRVFGPEQVEAAVEADRQREQAEKGRKQPRHSLDRGGR